MRGGPDHEWWCRVCLKARGQDDQTLIVDAVTARSDSNRPCPQAVLDAAGQTTTSRWRAVSDGRGPTGGSEGGWGVRGSLATGTAAKYSNRGSRTKPGKIATSRHYCTAVSGEQKRPRDEEVGVVNGHRPLTRQQPGSTTPRQPPSRRGAVDRPPPGAVERPPPRAAPGRGADPGQDREWPGE